MGVGEWWGGWVVFILKVLIVARSERGLALLSTGSASPQTRSRSFSARHGDGQARTPLTLQRGKQSSLHKHPYADMMCTWLQIHAVQLLSSLYWQAIVFICSRPFIQDLRLFKWQCSRLQLPFTSCIEQGWATKMVGGVGTIFLQCNWGVVT